MRQQLRFQIKALTVGAMLCALGVIVLSLGSLIEVLDLSVAVIASLLCAYAVIELGGIYPWIVWIVTSILSLLLLPMRSPVLFYALLTGYYPIVKEKIERHIPRSLSLLCKGAVALVACLLIYLICRAFLPSLLEGFETLPLLLLLLLSALAVFFLYDVCLTRLITFYLFRLRRRFRVK